jgi:hypothetical protein
MKLFFVKHYYSGIYIAKNIFKNKILMRYKMFTNDAKPYIFSAYRKHLKFHQSIEID